jgi:hypothetical protein
MAERLRAWLAGGHECDLDLGEGSAQDLGLRGTQAQQLARDGVKAFVGLERHDFDSARLALHPTLTSRAKRGQILVR